jgi:predicted phage tail protein|tara:strand:- start:1782 stop:2348 length:567 start_codon:yes stop_codon:yes gene_type:complete
MIKLTIYGRLKKFIGQSTFEIDVASPRQAFSFLINNFEGVADHIKEQEYCVMAGKVRITEQLLDLQTESDIKIIPVVHGEIFFFLAGAAFLGAGAIAATATSVFISGTLATAFTGIGASFLIQGVSELLFPPPTPPTFGGDEQDPSFTFDGTTNIAKQGVPINIVYGETLIGTNTVSANIDTLQVVNS